VNDERWFKKNKLLWEIGFWKRLITKLYGNWYELDEKIRTKGGQRLK